MKSLACKHLLPGILAGSMLLALTGARSAVAQSGPVDIYGDPYTAPVDPDPTPPPAEVDIPMTSDSDTVPGGTVSVKKLADNSYKISGSGTIQYTEFLIYLVKILKSGQFRVSIITHQPPQTPPLNPVGGYASASTATIDPQDNLIALTADLLSWLNGSTGATNNGSNLHCNTSTVTPVFMATKCQSGLFFDSSNDLVQDVNAKFVSTGAGSNQTILKHNWELTSTTVAAFAYSFSHRVQGQGSRAFPLEVYLCEGAGCLH
jgi:hypothetical protein